MQEFKKGQLVRVTHIKLAHGDDQFFDVGFEGEVIAQDNDSVVRVLFDTDAQGNVDWWYVNPDQLEVIE